MLSFSYNIKQASHATNAAIRRKTKFRFVDGRYTLIRPREARKLGIGRLGPTIIWVYGIIIYITPIAYLIEAQCCSSFFYDMARVFQRKTTFAQKFSYRPGTKGSSRPKLGVKNISK